MAVKPHFKGKNYWALILGGSSGFGLATAQKLAAEGMNLIVLHRDRRQTLKATTAIFEKLRALGVELHAYNVNALTTENREKILLEIKEKMGSEGRIRLLLHSIAKGNLKPMIPGKSKQPVDMAQAANLEASELSHLYQQLQETLDQGNEADRPLSSTDFQLTLEAMAYSLYDWVNTVFTAGFFAKDARVIGLTSEGNQKARRHYAAVSAAKAALEAICRSIALEFAPHGIRCNVVQPGVTDTPSLRMIPGHEDLKLSALLRNPFQRLTRPDDVAQVIYLLCRDEAAWINGAIIPVDGGERNS